MAARMEVSESAGGGDDREVVFNDQDSEKLCSVLLAITDKLDQLQKSARAKKALLQASGIIKSNHFSLTLYQLISSKGIFFHRSG